MDASTGHPGPKGTGHKMATCKVLSSAVTLPVSGVLSVHTFNGKAQADHSGRDNLNGFLDNPWTSISSLYR